MHRRYRRRDKACAARTIKRSPKSSIASSPNSQVNTVGLLVLPWNRSLPWFLQDLISHSSIASVNRDSRFPSVQNGAYALTEGISGNRRKTDCPLSLWELQS
jgi:hypothetical protein